MSDLQLRQLTRELERVAGCKLVVVRAEHWALDLFAALPEARHVPQNGAQNLRFHFPRYESEARENWPGWRAAIEAGPPLRFDPAWEVRVIPPSVGAMARFLVRLGERQVSVYLDVFNRLGSMDQPYWEAYPIGDDAARFPMGDTKGLMSAIRRELSGD